MFFMLWVVEEGREEGAVCREQGMKSVKDDDDVKKEKKKKK